MSDNDKRGSAAATALAVPQPRADDVEAATEAMQVQRAPSIRPTSMLLRLNIVNADLMRAVNQQQDQHAL